MTHHKLEVKDLQYAYPDGHRALDGISFCINSGESVGIIGVNGAGKSTLLMLLMGVLYPSKGEVYVNDLLVTKKNLSIIREKLGLVFQDPDNQLFMTTVYDDVAFGPRNYLQSKMNKPNGNKGSISSLLSSMKKTKNNILMNKQDVLEKEIEIRVLAALKLVGIVHLKDRAPFKLSGGEKRAAAIASVLSMQPEVLIMDEPSAGLDPKARRRIISFLKDFDRTMIITSHDLDMVFEICSRVIVINDGKIIADGDAEVILKNAELLDKCGLELPLSVQNCPVCGRNKAE